MKKQFYFLFITFILFGGFLKAQTAENWQPVILTQDGSNSLNGVEVNYLLGNDVIVVRLVNHTPSAVKANWKDLILTENGQNLSGNNKQESVNIAPKTKLSDDDGNTVQVTIKLSDFKTTAANFKNFNVSDFNVIVTQ